MKQIRPDGTITETAESPPAFIAPTLTNSWVNAGGAAAPAGYLIHGGVVILRGRIASGTIAAAAFTLPAGYRPSATLNFPCHSNGAFGMLTVNSAGEVIPAIGSNVSFSLDGVRFLPQ